MKKTIKRDNQYIGQLVTVTSHSEGQVYTVADFEGNNVVLQWREGNSQTRCTHDRDSLMLPTLAQVEYTIHASGALVSLKDVETWK